MSIRHAQPHSYAVGMLLLIVSVAMIVAFASVPIMPVAVIMVLAVPVPFIVAPAIRVPVVVGMTPVSAGIGRLFVAASNPAIMMSLRHPEAAYPYHRGRRRWWWRRFIGNSRWRYPDGDGNLTCGRQDERDCEEKTVSGSNFHLYLHLCAPCSGLRESGGVIRWYSHVQPPYVNRSQGLCRSSGIPHRPKPIPIMRQSSLSHKRCKDVGAARAGSSADYRPAPRS
jgi:hypothetical protein